MLCVQSSKLATRNFLDRASRYTRHARLAQFTLNELASLSYVYYTRASALMDRWYVLHSAWEWVSYIWPCSFLEIRLILICCERKTLFIRFEVVPQNLKTTLTHKPHNALLFELWGRICAWTKLKKKVVSCMHGNEVLPPACAIITPSVFIYMSY